MTHAPSADFCTCCEPGAPPAPLPIENRPGLAEIRWKTGSYATFRQAMIDTIASGARNPADPDDTLWSAEVRAALQALSSRSDDDYAIMLIDLFAAVADVLSFNRGRYAKEMFLRTARERVSLPRLVPMIASRLSPGVAATTALAFTLDKGARVRLTPGLKV